MAKKPPSAPGYEPAMGRPDPDAPAPIAKQLTHYPHSNGAVCGVYPAPSHARYYDPVNPTCPTCAKWYAAAKESTERRYGTPAAAPAPAPAEATTLAPSSAEPSPSSSPPPRDKPPTVPPPARTRTGKDTP
jgi:hypothetical protein